MELEVFEEKTIGRFIKLAKEHGFLPMREEKEIGWYDLFVLSYHETGTELFGEEDWLKTLRRLKENMSAWRPYIQDLFMKCMSAVVQYEWNERRLNDKGRGEKGIKADKGNGVRHTFCRVGDRTPDDCCDENDTKL